MDANSGESVQKDMDALKGDLAALRATMHQLVENVIKSGTGNAENAVKVTKETIKERPIMAVLLMFLLGLLLGRLVQRS